MYIPREANLPPWTMDPTETELLLIKIHPHCFASTSVSVSHYWVGTAYWTSRRRQRQRQHPPPAKWARRSTHVHVPIPIPIPDAMTLLDSDIDIPPGGLTPLTNWAKPVDTIRGSKMAAHITSTINKTTMYVCSTSIGIGIYYLICISTYIEPTSYGIAL
jgi:hypothetical protein